MSQSNANLTDIFTDIADAIREKAGTAETILPVNMADEIAAIPTGPAEDGVYEVDDGTISQLVPGIYQVTYYDGASRLGMGLYNVDSIDASQINLTVDSVYTYNGEGSFTPVETSYVSDAWYWYDSYQQEMQGPYEIPDGQIACYDGSSHVFRDLEAGLYSFNDSGEHSKYDFYDVTVLKYDPEYLGGSGAIAEISLEINEVYVYLGNGEFAPYNP